MSETSLPDETARRIKAFIDRRELEGTVTATLSKLEQCLLYAWPRTETLKILGVQAVVKGLYSF